MAREKWRERNLLNVQLNRSMQDLAATFSPRFPFFSLPADQRADGVTSSNRFFAHRSGLRTASRQAMFLRRGVFRFLAESDLLSRGSRFCCLKQKVGKHVPSGRLRKIKRTDALSFCNANRR